MKLRFTRRWITLLGFASIGVFFQLGPKAYHSTCIPLEYQQKYPDHYPPHRRGDAGRAPCSPQFVPPRPLDNSFRVHLYGHS